MRRLDVLRGVSASLDGVDVRAERQQQAGRRVDAVLAEHGVTGRLLKFIHNIGPDMDEYSEQWRVIIETTARMHHEERLAADPETLGEYTRLVVAAHFATEHAEEMEADQLQRLMQAMATFYDRHLRPTATDYADGLVDTKARVMAGARKSGGPHLHATAFNEWMADIDVFQHKAARHEYSAADLREVADALAQARLSVQADRGALHAALHGVGRVLQRHHFGPAHLEALEHQWRAYKVNKAVEGRIHDRLVGALQPATIAALAKADTYCWAPETTQAVAAAAESLPGDCALTATALGDLSEQGRCGWWWFQQPVPVQTTGKPGTQEPVVALLWRRGMREPAADTARPPSEFSFASPFRPAPVPMVWFQTFVMATLPTGAGGREQDVAIPTTSWFWRDGQRVDQLDAALREGYTARGARFSGFDTAGLEPTVRASMSFSRFFLAASAWLRQRIVVESVGTGTRQQARQLQRQHQLPEAPKVRIVELRRTQYTHGGSVERVAGDGTRRLTVRFVVRGFWRNQFYASRNEHAPKYIEPHMRGPADAPLKDAATVFMVRR